MLELIGKVWKALVSMRDAKGNLGKSWFRSKTMWINFIVLIGVVFTNYLNVTLSAEETASILAVENLVLRTLTSEPTGLIDHEGRY